jgi:hypothetical protein
VPTVSHLTDTAIYLSYGDTTIATSQQNKTGVWMGYRAIYHMSDNAANKTVSDSTGLHAATNVNNTNTRSTAGEIAGALTFDGSTDYATAADGTDLQSANVRTVSLWLKPTDLTGTTTMRVLQEYSNTSNTWAIVAETAGNADFNTIRASIRIAGTETQFKIPDNSLVTGGLYHFAVTFSGTGISALYLNGAPTSLLAPKQGTLGTGTAARLTIGARNDNSREFAGVLDEVRISSSVRTADWIRVEYNNQSSPGTFYSVSAEF